jgi:hypothetical protein
MIPKSIVWSMGNLSIPLDRARRVVLEIRAIDFIPLHDANTVRIRNTIYGHRFQAEYGCLRATLFDLEEYHTEKLE